jgi:hypothetical protein
MTTDRAKALVEKGADNVIECGMKRGQQKKGHGTTNIFRARRSACICRRWEKITFEETFDNLRKAANTGWTTQQE